MKLKAFRRHRDAQPAIIAWHNRITPQWLQLFSGYGEGNELGFDAVPKADGLLELRPQGTLKPDVYCFVQGDPLGMPYQLATWCFKVGQDAASGQNSGESTGGILWVLLILLAGCSRRLLLLAPREPGKSRTRRHGVTGTICLAGLLHALRQAAAGRQQVLSALRQAAVVIRRLACEPACCSRVGVQRWRKIPGRPMMQLKTEK